MSGQTQAKTQNSAQIKPETQIKEIIDEIISRIEKLEEERGAKVEIIVRVFEIIEKLVEKAENVEIKVETEWRQDYVGQVPYYYTFICRNRECRTLLRQSDITWGETKHHVARELLRDFNWDIIEALEHIKNSIY